jgi:hypothetical protein
MPIWEIDLVANLFGGNTPQPKMPDPVPQISQAMVAAEQSDNLLKKQRGVGTDILTSANGLSDLGTTKVAKAGGY